MLRGWARQHLGGNVRFLVKTSFLASGVGKRLALGSQIVANTALLPGGIGSFLIDARLSSINVHLPLATSTFFVGAKPAGANTALFVVYKNVFLEGMCLRVFHRRDSKTRARTPSKRYLFVEGSENSARTTPSASSNDPPNNNNTSPPNNNSPPSINCPASTSPLCRAFTPAPHRAPSSC